MITLCSLSQERVNLVNENDARLCLARETEKASD
jgi:hypothetical protein